MPEAISSYDGEVADSWIDINGHMNVTRYDDVFDAAESRCFALFGVDASYIARMRHGVFRLEKFVRYEREIMRGDAIAVRSRILATDLRRVRMFHELFNLTQSCRAATMENLSIHVDLTARRAAPIADPAVRAALAAAAAEHELLQWPDGATPRERAR